ncbi:hypothetical protein [Aureimonas pseudogalii]|uniref:TraW n=1 Tax=Aureimonas pseudogalii TaxID=1744844 RepID=A0A7W6MLR9_9HYPH|nr:hypothetical protein [Aureimonas pseudogalii]MBB4000110.1 hypothetical protein [Aureimonas pseudogalii]
MKRLVVLAALVASSTSMFAIVPSAYAVCDGCVVSAVNNMNANVSAQIQGTTQAVIAAQTAIVTALGQSTAQLSGYETRTARSQQRVEDAAQQIETMRQRDLARAKAEGGRYDPAASACTDLSGIIQFGGGGGGSQGVGGNDLVNSSRNWSRGNGPAGLPVTQGGLAVAQVIVADREELQGLGGYLDPTTDLRLMLEGQTLDTTDEKVAKASARLVNNVVDPTPARPLTDGEKRTPQGKAQLAARQIDEARRSAAHSVFSYLGDLAAPTGSSGLVDWAKRAAPASYSNTIGDAVSNQQVIDIFVQSRFANPDWHQQLATMAPEAVSREIALTNALNLHVNWMMFQLMKREAAVSATHLATELDNRDTSGTAITTRFESAAAQ